MAAGWASQSALHRHTPARGGWRAAGAVGTRTPRPPRIHPDAETDPYGSLNTQRLMPSRPGIPEPASSAPACVVGFHPACNCPHSCQGPMCAVPRGLPGPS
ncbi:hypothetical protein MG293_019527 [Ovis ammon polii]|uniref:Uncharacterized protein n=1 Tax=Ovis ammon polii TaxID=230172 RepID=A0AAD4Y114_OVIAM|nr:hypothetical protein MG293_019527 [Ovis ammon polii]